MRTLVIGSILVLGACGGELGTLEDPSLHAEWSSLSAAPPKLSNTARFEDATGIDVATNVSYCGGAGQATCAAIPPAVDPVQVRWGVPEPGDPRSGLGYTATPPQQVSLTGPFVIGSLTHYNFPVTRGTAVASVDLALQVRVDPAGGGTPLFNELIAIDLTIDETLNEEPCEYQSAAPCADAVILPSSVGRSFRSTVLPYTYTLDILGFNSASTGLGTPVTEFISQENGSTTA
ncbi:MAG TPA: choice-of-anchor K domain-containing protein, partial [Myxococcaceae bacterium]|nr:choice-of-anchor K domain-containing protein [Myxococcaceae bacterium]